MIDTANETRCKNPSCGKPIVQLPGHRKREYCNDTCKQTAYRLRKEQVHHDVTIVDDSVQQRIAQLEQDLAEANELIEKLLSKKQSKQPVKRGLQERLTRLLEQRDWPALNIHYRVNPGQKEGRVFILGASIELLSRALNQLEAQQS